jgi:transposase InsO family protein
LFVLTYIRLRTEFVYLAVVLDAFSRRVIGWALGRTLEPGLAIAALRMALVEWQPEPGLVHHSDRGVQYASQDYTTMLKQLQATIDAQCLRVRTPLRSRNIKVTRDTSS